MRITIVKKEVKEKEKEKKGGGGGGDSFNGLLWGLNEIMHIKRSAQELTQVIQSCKAMINKITSCPDDSATKERLNY